MPFVSPDLPPPIAASHVFFVPSRYKEEITLSGPTSLLIKVLKASATATGDLSIHLITRNEKIHALIQVLAKHNKLSFLFKQKEIQAAIGAPVASIIKIPPADSGSKEITYNELICTEADKANIAYIIQTLAENGKLSLLFKQGELKRLGAEINHVHPLKFLETIFANPALKACMRDISNDYFKWNGFLDGLVPSLTNQANQNKLAQHLNEFAKKTETNPKELAPYFQSQDWENLVRYLMNH